MIARWAAVHWLVLAGFASFGAAILLLVVEGVRTTRLDLLAIAGTCLLLAATAWISRHHMKENEA